MPDNSHNEAYDARDNHGDDRLSAGGIGVGLLDPAEAFVDFLLPLMVCRHVVAQCRKDCIGLLLKSAEITSIDIHD